MIYNSVNKNSGDEILSSKSENEIKGLIEHTAKTMLYLGEKLNYGYIFTLLMTEIIKICEKK